MALVVVGHGPGLAGLERQARLGAIERLDLRLLVDRQHDRVLGRGDVEADDILELGGEIGIVGALEGAHPVRLEVVRLPDPLHRAQADAARLGHRPAGPVGCLAGRLGAGQRHHALHRGGSQRASCPACGVASRNRPSTPASAKRRCQRHTAGRPTPARRATSATLSRVGRRQNEPSPRHVLLGAVAIGHDRLETRTIRGRNPRTDDLSHAPSMRTSVTAL